MNRYSKIRKTLLFIVVFSFSAAGVFACDICGCGNNNFQIGILPTFSKGFVGLRYTNTQFHSKMHHSGSEFSHDYYNTTEIWGGYKFKKIQMMAFLPYFNGKKVSDDGTTISSGLGDALILVHYRILNSASLNRRETTTMRNELYVGGGVKMPTGVNQVDLENPDFNIGDFNSQAGTGSVDFLFNITHNLMWNNSGIVTNAAYRINSENQQGYKFGDRTYLNSSYYHSFAVSKINIRPHAGFNFQTNALNTYVGSEVEDSNGYTFNSALGLNVLRDNVGINATVFIPVTQNLNADQTKLQSQVTLGVTYSF